MEAMAARTIPTTRNVPATAPVLPKNPFLVAASVSPTPHMPVGFAMTCVTLTRCPSGCVDTPRLVIKGGMLKDKCPAESVVEMNMGEDRVVSGLSVTVLTDTLEGPLAAGAV